MPSRAGTTTGQGHPGLLTASTSQLVPGEPRRVVVAGDWHGNIGYQRECDFGYGPVEVTGLDMDGSYANHAMLDVEAMEWSQA